MNRKLKKAVSILSAVFISTGLLAGCGSSGTTAAVNDTTSSVTTAEAEHKAEVTLISFAGKTLKVKYEDKEYTLDISKALINTNVMHSGDKLIIYYDGELSEDPDKFTVISVENTSAEDDDSAEIVGTLEEITMNSITIRTNDGRIITFNANNAEHSFSYGINEGNWVTIIYDGELNGTDTTNLAVTKIHDEDTEHVKEVKAQTTIEEVNDTVYALEKVYVRSSYMMASEVVGSLEAGQEVKRTGRCNNGWDRIIFEGKDAYVYGSILTTNPNEVGMKGSLTPLSQKVNIKSRTETVYAKADANVRQGYSTASPSIGALKAGTAVTRTGICDNGWSRISFEGRDAFVYSDLLTTKNPNSEQDGVRITAVNETVFAVTDANVRESFSVDSKAVGALAYGDNVVRTGICSNGWSRIIYDNKDAYVNSDLISKTNPIQVVVVKIYVTKGYAWATTDANIRESFNVESKVIGLLKQGEGIEVTGVTDNSWTRVSYNGQVGFIHNDLLTSVNPKKGTPTKTPDKPTKTPDKPTKTPDKPTKTPDKPTKTPDKPTTAPDKPTTAPDKPTVIPEPIDDSSEESETESIPDESSEESETESIPDESSEESETESIPDESPEESGTESLPDDSSAESETENIPDEETDESDSESYEEPAEESEEEPVEEPQEEPEEKPDGTISGEVVGYDIDTVTIKVDDEPSDDGQDDVVAEEPVQEEPEGTEDEYPSMTYEEADGEESTYYTFDITNASQSYSDGINEGNDVTVTYSGDLDNMDDVQATNVSDSAAGAAASDSVFRGSVESTTVNTVTIITDEGVKMTFSYDRIEELELNVDDKVKVTADVNAASHDENVIAAKKIEKV